VDFFLEQQKQIEALNESLQKVSDRVEVSKTAPQVVNSSRLLRSGWLTITNKRLLFVGGSEDRTIPLNKVVFVNSNVTGIVLSVERRQKPIALEAANSLIASLIIRLCCQVSDPLNLSGDNINIDFKEWIEGVGEIQDLVESQIADSSSKNAVNCSSARTPKRFSVAAMRVSNPDCSSLEIHSYDTTQLHPALLSFSATISQYRFTQPGFWLFYSPNGIKNQTATEFRSLYRGDCPHFS
jgi:hypothetical protein